MAQARRGRAAEEFVCPSRQGRRQVTVPGGPEERTPCPCTLREVTQGRVADIVMGTHGRRGFSRLALGSDAERVVRGSAVPVLLVRREAAD